MSAYGTRCTMGDGEDTLITVEAANATDAARQVLEHKDFFYGPGDGAGRWLAARLPETTITAVHETKPLSEWGSA